MAYMLGYAIGMTITLMPVYWTFKIVVIYVSNKTNV